MSNYQDLKKINVNEHTEKKGNLTYLSWAWAVDQLLQNDPTATWRYGEPKEFGNTLMVFCTVKAFDKEMTAQLPVIDYKNQAIENPNAMQVNTAMQRCLAKAIALHGIGLYIYAGEDLPPSEDGKKIDMAVTSSIDAYNAGDIKTAHDCIYQDLENNEQISMAWSKLKDMPALRRAIKEYRNTQQEAA